VGAFYAFKALLPERLFAEVAVKGNNMIVDSLLLLAAADSAYEQDATEVNIETNVSGMTSFYRKLFELEKTKKGSVRIAYFGDSQTESDRIVQDIRKNYQKKYGGSGIGFVPLSIPELYFGSSIKFQHSGWNTYSILAKSPVSLGVSGNVSMASGASAWTRYRAGTSLLARPTLYYGNSKNKDATVTVTTEKGTLAPIKLKPQGLLNKRSLSPWAKELTVQFDNAESIPFYGINFSGGSGVNIDNFASRGNSGLPLGYLNMNLMNAFHREFGYDLIVLQFGANVITPKLKQYGAYSKKMSYVVSRLKKYFPGADILVISMSDKATKYGTQMKTDSVLASLIHAQGEYAGNTNSSFINLFHMMGGEGSMVKWVENNPALAATDYTHFSSKGAKKIADLIFEKLEEEYEKFKKQNE